VSSIIALINKSQNIKVAEVKILKKNINMQKNANIVDPAFAMAARGRYWYFSMASIGTEGTEAPEGGIENKMQRLLEAEGMHTTTWERIDVNKQIDGIDGATALFKIAIVVHGLVRWGGPVRGKTLQKDTFGLSPPAPALSKAPDTLTDVIKDAARGHAGVGREAVESVRLFLVDQRGTALKPHLTDDLETTLLGVRAKYGPKGEADPNRWGASLDGGEAMEDGDNAEGKGNNDGKKVEERLLEIKGLIDTGGCEMSDIREDYYVDYLRHRSSFQADIAQKKEAAVRMPGVEYNMLSTWQRECVHLATQTEPDDRSIHWYVDEVGGKVISSSTPGMKATFATWLHLSFLSEHRHSYNFFTPTPESP
jgi:hypothetical protein